MVKTLVKHGNSYALVIDKPILELLKITPDTRLELSTDGSVLHIQPAKPEGTSFAEASEWIHERYAETFRILAQP